MPKTIIHHDREQLPGQQTIRFDLLQYKLVKPTLAFRLGNCHEDGARAVTWFFGNDRPSCSLGGEFILPVHPYPDYSVIMIELGEHRNFTDLDQPPASVWLDFDKAIAANASAYVDFYSIKAK